MEYYNQLLNMWMRGFITDAECILRILNYFGDNPGSYRAVEAQAAKDKQDKEQESLDEDSKWLIENY